MDGYVPVAVTALLCVLSLVAGLFIATGLFMGVSSDSSGTPTNKEQ